MGVLRMSGLVQRIIAALATFGSFAVLAIQMSRPEAEIAPIQIVLITLAAIGCLFTLAFEIIDHRKRTPKAMASDKDIRNYMFTWIGDGGRVAILSRRLGWVDDDEMRAMLLKKAERGELTLVIPKPVSLSSELGEAGAEIIYYGESGYTIRSRFTIIHRERTDTAVAIGRKGKDGKHLVREFKTSDEEPAFWLAEDLIEILRRFNPSKLSAQS